ncbi:MAG: hypothetical protein M1830_000939, partial [Pleopsidium flavum]
MLARTTVQQSLRRLAVQQPGAFSRTALSKFAAPAAVATNNHKIQSRPVATQTIRANDAHEILVKQRLNRPVSPHLSIYKPQITWYGSALNRITGSVLSGGFYVFGAAYLVAPLFGWHLESASMAAAFGAWPVALKVATKMTVAMPFTYHSFNGIRHLVWDMGKEMSNKQVQRTGWTVVGLTVSDEPYLSLIRRPPSRARLLPPPTTLESESLANTTTPAPPDLQKRLLNTTHRIVEILHFVFISGGRSCLTSQLAAAIKLTSTSGNHSTSHFDFLGLPPELRLCIYEYLL